ncbi:hypothetical protein ABZT06_09045 [Streptomyces sp. NPDC005483]|uniref:hypothetical protein n=1 Tax=Streptomyces sp. NPDC005483 TaxID=3154882 RepID=UPI0033A092DB
MADGPGASAAGGSGAASLFQQNTAQERGQNNNCANPSTSTAAGATALVNGSVETRCASGDLSFNKYSVVDGGDAHAAGGSGTGTAAQQNTAQAGRQNNNCANSNDSDIALTGGRVDSGCTAKDTSHTKDSRVEGGDAHAEGGSSAGGLVQQNTAQSGRQNNNCANPNGSTVIAGEGGRVDSECTAKDASHTKDSRVEGGDAHAEGGSSAGANAFQQNTAQSGRQNNNCANPNGSGILLTGGRTDSECTAKDTSHTKDSRVEGGDAHAEGGSSAGGLVQQNTAQSGRQNNNCANPNSAVVTAGEGGRVDSGCAAKDASHTKDSRVEGGGAHAEGGSSAGGLVQQNTAQSGRQNNNCASPNNSVINAAASRAGTGCETVDHSKNVGTVEVSDGAEAKGGSSTLDLFQQNTAQSGRQNNNCGNPNDVTLTDAGSRTQTQCVAVDRSTNIGTVNR